MRLLAALLLASCASSREYVESGRYDREVAAVAAEAEAFLAQHPPSPKLAIVLDVDDTALSSMPAMKANGYRSVHTGGCELPQGPCNALVYLQQGEMPPIRPVLHLAQRAHELHVAVIFVTGRNQRLRAVTESNLRKAGYPFDALILKTASEPNGVFKPAARKKLVEQGFQIAVNIGDQESDLSGGYAERTFKVPNPFYSVP